MFYPWWYVSGLTAPMLIAIIAVVHVIVSHYAVGGGILLAMENHHAIKTGNGKLREYWKKHAKFFVLLTVVFGAITGVGIWWTIGLASPLATEILIRIFVFGWAIEWVFFVVELTAAFAFYYYWDRLPPKTHAVIGGIYAIAAWISLVLITGITAFMLNIDGVLGDWSKTGDFWHAFINVQWLPQTITRTGIALMFGTLYVYAHATIVLRDDENTRVQVIRRMNKPFLCGLILVLAGFVGWFVHLPEISRVVLERSAALNVLSGLFVAAIVLIFILAVLGPMRDPKTINGGFAVCLLLFGIAALATGEFVREAVRKPYIVDRVVLGNQILVNDVERFQKTGFLENGYWTSLSLQKQYPQLWHAENEDRFAENELLHYPKEERLAAGRMIFMHHCNNCHAAEHGLSAIGPLVYGKTQTSLVQTVKHLNNVITMPPWCGNDAEANLLAEYLLTLAPNAHPTKENVLP
ncbi:MAG: cytochrome ubiquinol oxidase subunit I [Planctomycetaceae bacterium]|jgi:cytochrome bd-type quinol oxidase subunit 1/mono/diheme cytochrome c family protein|nr:cytochrome ubiquinol oxidase subunit I [Planctomycetaceae bacterium]